MAACHGGGWGSCCEVKVRYVKGISVGMTFKMGSDINIGHS